MNNLNILVTGGAGYIGSHTCVALLNAGHRVTILDSLCNSHATVIDRLEEICKIRPKFIHGDVRDAKTLDKVFRQEPFDAVVHFAGLKAVGESVTKPLRYFDNNVGGTVELLLAMQRAQVKTFLFSSSATVYGIPKTVPIGEDFPCAPANPYGQSKLMVEDILQDLSRAEPDWRMARLRYFNPVGAHESGLIGENPSGAPNNLMPYISQVAVGRREKLYIYGADYPTPDGTGVRDYIHVMDLAEGHVSALNYLSNNAGGLITVNLGTGRGYSVLEVVKTFEQACGRPIPYVITERRSGDIAMCWANPNKAFQLLGWGAKNELDVMCRDAWRWQQKNPNGYQ